MRAKGTALSERLEFPAPAVQIVLTGAGEGVDRWG